MMQTRPFILFTLLAFSACARHRDLELTPYHQAVIQDSVRVFLKDIPHGLASEGPMAWLRYFETVPAFFMASDGKVVFSSYDTAAVFLEGFSKDVAAIDLMWDRIEIEPLAPGVAAMAASYHERIVMNDSTVSEFGGYVTGVVRNHASVWKLQHLHWSSPMPAE